jgi:biotin carboxyl carrier protein
LKKTDIIEVEPGVYSVLLGTESYEIRVNGETADFRGALVPVEVADIRDSQAGKRDAKDGPVKISAAMPGRVIRVLVEEGDAVQTGQGIVVVEAMKMQNEMKSPRAGRVSAVRVKPGATVSAGELLALIE